MLTTYSNHSYSINVVYLKPFLGYLSVICKPRSQILPEGLLFNNFCFLQILPIHFMKAQRTKIIPKYVDLRIELVSHMWWKLRLFKSPSRKLFNFTFPAASIQFATHNCIVCGDILVFSKLTANMSKFQVYLFD